MNDVVALRPELTKLAHEAGAAFQRARHHGREAIREYLNAGALLVQAKERCPHGHWTPFLQEAGIAERTARNMMRLARSGLKSATVADLGGVKAVSYAPGLLDAAIDHGPDVVERALQEAAEIRRAMQDLADAGGKLLQVDHAAAVPMLADFVETANKMIELTEAG